METSENVAMIQAGAALIGQPVALLRVSPLVLSFGY